MTVSLGAAIVVVGLTVYERGRAKLAIGLEPTRFAQVDTWREGGEVHLQILLDKRLDCRWLPPAVVYTIDGPTPLVFDGDPGDLRLGRHRLPRARFRAPSRESEVEIVTQHLCDNQLVRHTIWRAEVPSRAAGDGAVRGLRGG
ncbi:MAG: hypothetical protein AAFR16_09595 [Pseudomonadota bacterium]